MSSNRVVVGHIIESLNKQQLVATQFDPTKALQVIAGPGTGKTKVLTSRVAYLILHHNISPKDIIVTTFTNKAAKEMVQRIQELLVGTDINANDLMIGTFHSICLRILSRFGDKVGLVPGWRITEEKELDVIINEIIEKMPDQIRDYANSFERLINMCRPIKNGEDWAVHPKMVKKEISRLKSSAILPDEYMKEDVHDTALAYFYEKYQTSLRNINALDFDDLLMYCFRLLSKERCLPQVKHVFVDEFQDTNSIQMDLMYLMAKGNHHLSRGITVVGDPDQSIYAFRNALAQNFEQMISKCPIECSQVVLVENYRSSQKILDTSETLIKQQLKGRNLRAPLKAQFDCEFPPVYVNFPVSFVQGPSLAKELLYLKALPELFTYDDFAILVRQRRQIKNIETSLIEHRIPYKIVRGHAFWELKEINAMLNLLRCVNSKHERNSIIASLLYPSRGLGQTSAEKIKAVFDKYDGSPFDALYYIIDGGLTLGNKIESVIRQFISMIENCKDMMKIPSETSLGSIFDKLYELSGLQNEYLHVDGKKKSDESKSEEPDYDNPRHKNVKLLRKYFMGLRQMEDSSNENENIQDKGQSGELNTGLGGLSVQEYICNFFNSLSLYTSDAPNASYEKYDKPTAQEGCVTISTIHGAKGLEWPVVFIPGCVEGIIPSVFQSDKDETDDDESETDDNKSSGSPKKGKYSELTLDEERRMFFVAQTRAKVLLYLSSVEESNNPMFGGPSRFFTSDLLKTLADDQKVFENERNIKILYHSMNKRMPKNIPSFSFKTLIKDYKKFIKNRRESMIWNDFPIRSMFNIDLKRNRISSITSVSEFTTAAVQLKSQNTSIKLERNFAPTYIGKKKFGSGVQLSPTKRYAPMNNVKRSPSPSRQFAPKTDYIEESPSKKKLITSRNPNKHNTMSTSKEGINLKETKSNNIQSQKWFSSTETISGSTKAELTSQSIPHNNNYKRPASSSLLSSSRNIITQPINLTTSATVVKKELFVKDEDIKMEETTAAQILHDPTNLKVDNRPIIASAKTLADAIRKPKSKGLKRSKNGDTANIDIKKEHTSSQFDILSQLTKARKKAKANDGEIIIIDD